jgi:hypothetical protein
MSDAWDAYRAGDMEPAVIASAPAVAASRAPGRSACARFAESGIEGGTEGGEIVRVALEAMMVNGTATTQEQLAIYAKRQREARAKRWRPSAVARMAGHRGDRAAAGGHQAASARTRARWPHPREPQQPASQGEVLAAAHAEGGTGPACPSRGRMPHLSQSGGCAGGKHPQLLRRRWAACRGLQSGSATRGWPGKEKQAGGAVGGCVLSSGLLRSLGLLAGCACSLAAALLLSWGARVGRVRCTNDGARVAGDWLPPLDSARCAVAWPR